MNVLSLFSGIGAFEKALKNIKIDFNIINYCEIDKYASKAYSLIYDIDESKNLKDVTKVNTITLSKDIDMITYGFPCTDISIAGNQKGFKDENNELTRSGLFFEALRIIEDIKPKFAICENVKNLTGNRFKKEFEIILSSLESAGYSNYWKVLNAKDFGTPQSRERIFIISIRNDIDKGYEFPNGFPLKLRLKDILEESVDEKYYLPDRMIDCIKVNAKDCGFSEDIKPENIKTLTTIKTEPVVKQIGNCMPTKTRSNPNQGRVYDQNYLSPALTTMQGGSRQPMIIEDVNKVTAAAMRGRYDENGKVKQNIEISNREYANTITTVQKDSLISTQKRIRKLTPKECFRLMGFYDHDVDLLSQNKISNSQLYKMAGNSICVSVLENIFTELQKQYPEYFK